MKKFKFRLERVLQYRELIRSEKKRLLTAAIFKLEEAKELRDSLLESRAINEEIMSCETDTHKRYLAELYAERLKVEIEAAEQTISMRQLDVNQARDEYIEAAKEAEALKILKEKQAAEYAAFVDREEAKVLDELSVQRSARKLFAKK